ncbi:preprotein translocase subunit SecA [Litchfieldella anticariensis FP35 = DSM 16096]|uniref:Preprotein translocase subunit SecA n=1 Tax=Litchfieldella anticariensis (strain DSM 16096 / CECT 5854 / CIP 108499 / LMG 22089 / FP35) TaxID=1121939 RepID=S2LDK8_LITA3|nr:ion transporter [Halomonas anticariensis]EPC02856.1 preprotein translocase subunit SecA [Halomonas anticariensis FP35 = DSM 16096]
MPSSTLRPLNLILERAHLAWDLAIIVLVIANLALLLFDSLFLLPPLNAAFESLAPSLYSLYDRYVHANFVVIDLAFVAVFILDVLLGWAVAIAQRRYHRWFFYPFVHWYDVLGCIPVGGFRLLRVLRVISLLHRLQRLGLIDIRRWQLYAVYAKYYDILMEELSDRIALRMLSGVQDQVRASDSLSRRLADDVVMPRKQQLIHEITRRLEDMAGNAYAHNRGDLMRYVSALVGRTLAESREIQRLKRLPMGSQLANALDSSLSDIACRLVHEAVEGLRSPEFNVLVERIADSGFDAWLKVDKHTDRVTEQVLIDMLEMLKDKINVKQWRDKYD